MSKKLIILLLLLFFLLITYFVLIRQAPKYTLPKPPNLSTPTPPLIMATNLSMEPNLTYAPATRSAQLDISVNYQGTAPTTAQLELAYDPQSLTNISISPGPYWQNPTILLNSIDLSSGRISYAITSLADQSKAPRSNTIAQINFAVNATASRESSLIFLPKTTVSNNGRLIPLNTLSGAKIIIMR